MRIGLRTGLLLIACTGGCRQRNPDWMGPGDPTQAGASSTGGEVTSTGGEVTSTGGEVTSTGSGDSGCDPATERSCNGVCEDVMTDRKNCGECGHICIANTQCVDGMCR